MKRHFLGLPLMVIKKRGLYIISALLMVVGIISPLKVSAAGAQLSVTAISFRSNTETNTSGSTINDQRWLVYSFDFDDYYTGTFTATIRISKASGYVVYQIVNGAYSTYSRNIITGQYQQDTYEDTYTFTISDCKHFNVIYTMPYGVLSGAGVNVGSLDNLVISSSGSGGAGSVDYTSYLQDIDADIQSAIQFLDDLGATVEPLALTVTNIYNTLTTLSSTVTDIDQLLNEIGTNIGSFFNLYYRYNMPWYTFNLYWLLQRNGYGVETTYSALFKQLFGWYMNPPATFPASSYTFTLTANRTYLLVVATSDQIASVVSLSNSNGTITKSITLSNVSPTVFNRTYKYAVISDITSTTSFRITNFTHADYVFPVYFGVYESAPEEVLSIIGKPSNNNLIQQIVDLFKQNNSQNEEIKNLLQSIDQSTQSIDNTVQGLESSLNTGLNDVPINENAQQLQGMSAVFEYNNDIFSRLWSSLGKITIVLTLYMLLVLIRLFVHRERG